MCSAFSPYIIFPHAKNPSADVSKSTTSGPNISLLILIPNFLTIEFSGTKPTDNNKESHFFFSITLVFKFIISTFLILVSPSISITLEFSIIGISKPSIISFISSSFISSKVFSITTPSTFPPSIINLLATINPHLSLAIIIVFLPGKYPSKFIIL